ncbi:MAG: S41 family peptidase [Hyphomicrobiaceae bacterium]|nr:S41 family peptidase [Hyphomicrobiaceae bacterium]
MTSKRSSSAAALFLAASLLVPCGPASAQRAKEAASGDALTRHLEVMLRAMKIARDWHVGRPGKPELMAGAARGMLHKLDPEADLYTRAELQRIGDTDSVPQVGLDVRREQGPSRRSSPGYRVVSSRDGGPAAAIGLKAGDLITRVRGRAAGDMSYHGLLRLELPGAIGTDVDLTVERGDNTEPERIRLPRGMGIGEAVTVDEPELGVLRVRIAAIEAPATSRLTQQIEAAVARSDPPLRGIVLDLRGTAGGSLAEVASLADALLDSGLLLREETRLPSGPEPQEARTGDVAQGRPVTVLVDAGTAGPAEALAAALRDNQRARLVGEKTAGRGALRTMRSLGRQGEKGAIRIITARLSTPGGKPIEGAGVTPDLVISQAPADATCRSLDVRDPRQGGHCRRRNPAEDAQLQRAIATLTDAVAAGTPAAGKDIAGGRQNSTGHRP